MSPIRHRRRRDGEPGDIRTFGVRYANGYVLEGHSHAWHQLVFAAQGLMEVDAERARWVVPPQRALWVPANTKHRIRMSGEVAMRTLYLRPSLGRRLPRRCEIFEVTPLLRELVLRAVRMGILDRAKPDHRRYIGVLLDELAVTRRVAASLPLPRRREALWVAHRLSADPSDAAGLPALARAAHSSARTLERAFRAETGLSFRQWRAQLRLLHGMARLGRETSITEIALGCGYASTSAFIAAFRRAFGTSPGKLIRRGAANG